MKGAGSPFFEVLGDINKPATEPAPPQLIPARGAALQAQRGPTEFGGFAWPGPGSTSAVWQWGILFRPGLLFLILIKYKY